MKAQQNSSKQPNFTEWLQHYAEHLRQLCISDTKPQAAPPNKPKQ